MGFLSHVWEVTKSIVHYGKAEQVFESVIKEADIRKALAIYVLAGLYSSLLAVLLNVFVLFTARSVYMMAGVYVPEVELTWEVVTPYAIYFLGFVFPFGLISTLLPQLVIYKVLNLTKGKGTLAQQLYLYSFIALALSLALTVMLSMFFPCLGYLVLTAYLIFMGYMYFYIQTIMLKTVHKVGTWHALGAVLAGMLVVIGLVMLSGHISEMFSIYPPAAEEILGITNSTLISGQVS